ncbi:multicopper oxidase family protein [Rubrivirga sp.]|uniref:multicopper oxidase family protein n=1 Tax=Rubrivirga sp. TaxID=1885344 RepID=UPI003B521145
MSTFSRRDWMKASAVALGGAALGRASRATPLPVTFDPAAAADSLAADSVAAANAARAGAASGPSPRPTNAPRRSLATLVDGERPSRVHTPNGSAITGRRADDGAWVYHLTAQEVVHEFAPGLTATCWGYNGQVHGPTFEAVEGDRVRIYVTNKLPVATTVHWHGFFIPSGMDGVGGLSQAPIAPGETFLYEFPISQNGTFMYHSHHDEMTQIALGLTGMFVVHKRGRDDVDRDVAIMLHEWLVEPGTSRPDPNAMADFNVLTMNGRAFPGTDPIVVGHNDRVRFRFGNLSPMDHHPIHLHGHYWTITATDGGPIPPAGRWPETTVLVPVGSTRTVEWTADALGDWAMHCHMTHHVMNQMGHEFPNMVGVDARALDRQVQPLAPGYHTMGQVGGDDMGAHVEMGHMPVPENSIPMVGAAGPFGYITMGGMYTNVKVRPRPVDVDRDPGWYDHPEGTVARAVSAERAARDGVTLS